MLLSNTYDPDALNYIKAVELADGQSLENNVKFAINNFVKGCKSDGVWLSLGTCCIMSGARTLAGALVPLRGVAPTNINFLKTDYNRKTGITPNSASGKYLNTNRVCASDGQNNTHMAVYASQRETVVISGRYISGIASALTLLSNTDGFRVRSNSDTLYSLLAGNTNPPRFAGMSRGVNTSFDWRYDGQGGTVVENSTTTSPGNYTVFASNDGMSQVKNTQISFYSAGSAVNLSLLDVRVTLLMDTLNGVL